MTVRSSRTLEIFVRLLNGQKLTKKDLMEDYGVSESTIQRDIADIEAVLGNYYVLADFDEPKNSKEKKFITSNEKGTYFLNRYYLYNHLNLSEEEIFVVSSILLASRALPNDEMAVLLNKLLAMSRNEKRWTDFIKSDRAFYQGVPDDKLLAKVQFICEAVVNGSLLEFEYRKNDVTKTLRRVPTSVYFSDMYFYMITSNERGEDGRDLGNLNKFRINNIKERPKIIEKNTQSDRSKHFEGGMLRTKTGYAYLGNPIDLVIDFNYDPVYVLDRFPNSEIIAHENEIYRIKMKVNDGYGVKMWLLQQGEQVKVISPSYMRDYIINDMKKSLGYYGLKVVKDEE